MLLSLLSVAQQSRIRNSADIYMQMKKLNVLGTVLYVAAHPDDENNTLLPYLAKERLYRTAYLSLTRGEGGQNLIGPEQGVELGLIRTQELLAARAMDGSEQYFTRAYEFGFSKSSKEALTLWNHDDVLSDVVLAIRKLQPDVIVARFPPDARAGHGHHAASAIIAAEAYKAAADSTKFPEQLRVMRLKPWKAKRLVWNSFNFSGADAAPTAGQVKMDVSAYNPFLGESYGELGAEARTMHKSQGEGRPRRRGKLYEFFTHVDGDSAATDLMDGVVTNWSKIEGGEKIAQLISSMIAGYRIDKPEASVPALVELYKQVRQLPETTWQKQKLQELARLIQDCAGLYAEAVTTQATVLELDSVKVNVQLVKRNDVKATIKSIQFSDPRRQLTPGQEMETGKAYGYEFIAPVGRASSQPYWLFQKRIENMYNVPVMNFIGDSWSAPVLTATMKVEIEGLALTITEPVNYKYTDPTRGELFQPLAVAPRVSMYLSPAVLLLNVKDDKNKQRADSMLHIVYNSNFTAKQIPFTAYIRQDSVRTVFRDEPRDFEKGKQYVIDVPASTYYNPKGKINYLEASLSAKVGGKDMVFSDFFKKISYPHIPDMYYAFRDNIKVIDSEIKVKGSKVGYVAGSGDVIPESLKQLGFDVKILTDADITDDNLKQFDAIVTGVRAYNMNEFLTNKYDVMMRYVENGGNLVVQYNRNLMVGAVPARIGPYPFNINSSLRVTEEEAEVKFLLPGHTLLNYPNKITQEDFRDWIQERSTYQADQADSRYQAPLGMHDSNENESTGSLITAPYGKGNFAYVSLVLFRQLPAGNPGAFRLLANLVAMPKNK